jgi:hypothetical protein
VTSTGSWTFRSTLVGLPLGKKKNKIKKIRRLLWFISLITTRRTDENFSRHVRPQDDILHLARSLESPEAEVVWRALATLQSLDPPTLFHSDHWLVLSAALKCGGLWTLFNQTCCCVTMLWQGVCFGGRRTLPTRRQKPCGKCSGISFSRTTA